MHLSEHQAHRLYGCFTQRHPPPQRSIVGKNPGTNIDKRDGESKWEEEGMKEGVKMGGGGGGFTTQTKKALGGAYC